MFSSTVVRVLTAISLGLILASASIEEERDLEAAKPKDLEPNDSSDSADLVSIRITLPDSPRQNAAGTLLGRRLQNRRLRRGRQFVCYDDVGCVAVGRNLSRNRLLRDNFEALDTEFLLYTRSNPEDGQRLKFEKAESLKESNYDPKKPTKFIIHGFRGSGKLKRPIANKDAFLRKGHYNVVIVNWEKAVSTQNYLRAITNAELVANQLMLLIHHMIETGASPKNMHLVGCSLGAHLAGFTAQALQARNIKLGQITGVDPAGVLFLNNNKIPARGIDKTDADFVEVIHSDAGFAANGRLGVRNPVGHVDYFPNGGTAQPGCLDPQTLAGTLHSLNHNVSRICSHTRAWDIYIESLNSGCQFIGFPCPGLRDFDRDFVHGNCFNCYQHSCGVIGRGPNETLARGPLYLVTRGQSPFCGDQLKATLFLSHKTLTTRGKLQLLLNANGSVATFDMNTEVSDIVDGGQVLTAITAAEPGFLVRPGGAIASLSFTPHRNAIRRGLSNIYFDKLSITDQAGNSLSYCDKDKLLEDADITLVNSVVFDIRSPAC